MFQWLLKLVFYLLKSKFSYIYSIFISKKFTTFDLEYVFDTHNSRILLQQRLYDKNVSVAEESVPSGNLF